MSLKKTFALAVLAIVAIVFGLFGARFFLASDTLKDTLAGRIVRMIDRIKMTGSNRPLVEIIQGTVDFNGVGQLTHLKEPLVGVTLANFVTLVYEKRTAQLPFF